MTEEQAQAVLNELARIIEANKPTAWFHGHEREKHIAQEIADYVLSGMKGRGEETPQPSPATVTAIQAAWQSGFQEGVSAVRKTINERFTS